MTRIFGFKQLSLKTAFRAFVATRELNLAFEVDRVDRTTGHRGRTGVYITTGDRRVRLFAQNVGENNWQVNVNPGNPTGGGTTLAAFSGVTDLGRHRMKLVADGEFVEVFLDGQSGGRFPFEVTSEFSLKSARMLAPPATRSAVS